MRAVADSADLTAKVKALADFRTVEKRYAEATAWNAACHWAKADQQRFAAILNQHRMVVDYQPLRLDEGLSAACTGHSLEMVNLKYFSHESPVTKNKGFGDRANNAGFDGFASGECIFAGGRAGRTVRRVVGQRRASRHHVLTRRQHTRIGDAGRDHWTLDTGTKNGPSPQAQRAKSVFQKSGFVACRSGTASRSAGEAISPRNGKPFRSDFHRRAKNAASLGFLSGGWLFCACACRTGGIRNAS